MNCKYLSLLAAVGLSGAVLVLPGVSPAKPSAKPAKAQDGAALVAQGAAVFTKVCAGCHSAEPGQPSYGGPNLAGVVGRPAAAGKFRYSSALRKSGLTWTKEELDTYVASPTKKVPGTSMFVAVPDVSQRAAVIAFLASKP